MASRITTVVFKCSLKYRNKLKRRISWCKVSLKLARRLQQSLETDPYGILRSPTACSLKDMTHNDETHAVHRTEPTSSRATWATTECRMKWESDGNEMSCAFYCQQATNCSDVLPRSSSQKFFHGFFMPFISMMSNIMTIMSSIMLNISTWFIHHCHCQLAKALVFTSSSVSFPGFSGSSIAGRFQDLHLIRRELHSLLGLVLYPQRSQRASPVWDVHPCHMSHKSGVKLVVGYGVIRMEPSSCHPICRDAVTSLIYHGFASFLARRLAVFFL